MADAPPGAAPEAPADLYLASQSPRRRELLEQLGVRYRVCRADVPEIRDPRESPGEYVERVARDKATAVLAHREAPLPVLGADTDVVLDDVVLGKPVNAEDARFMLTALSDRTHQVMSAVAITDGDRTVSRLQISEVTFGPLDDAMIAAYWDTGEPADKAGAYGIQGLGAAFVARLEGSYSGVMGLPLFETAALLRDFGIQTVRQAA